jgi:hypothetical protein
MRFDLNVHGIVRWQQEIPVLVERTTQKPKWSAPTLYRYLLAASDNRLWSKK